MRLRSLCAAVALSLSLLGSGCCCHRPFHCFRPFRCLRCGGCGGCGCASCCSPVVSEGAVSYSPGVVTGPGCDCGGPSPVEPPVIIRPTPAPGGVITTPAPGPINPMPPASAITPLPGPGPLTRSK